MESPTYVCDDHNYVGEVRCPNCALNDCCFEPASSGKQLTGANECPVCYYAMPDPPCDYNICPRCGTEFGNDDDGKSHEQLRRDWINGDVKFFFQRGQLTGEGAPLIERPKVHTYPAHGTGFIAMCDAIEVQNYCELMEHKLAAQPIPGRERIDHVLSMDYREVVKAVQNTEYAKDKITHHLMNMTNDQRRSLFRAVITLAAPPAPKGER